MLLSAWRLVLWPAYRREVVAVLSEVVVTCHVRGNSLEGYTKRSGRNRGRSPRYIDEVQLSGRQYLVITMIIIKASCDYDDDYQGTVLQTVSPCHITPGQCPGLRSLRLVQPSRLTDA